MKIIILGFNVGISKGFVNGPGMSLLNFAKFISKYSKDIDLIVYTHMKSSSKIPGVRIEHIGDMSSLKRDIKTCFALHCWSGLTSKFENIVKMANLYMKPVILGPNLFDTVEFKKEKLFLNNIRYNKILTVNDRLKYLIASQHFLPIEELESFIVGPDVDIWTPPDEYEKYILWKGNSRHMVKDIKFAKKVASRLDKYQFLFLGEGSPYSYNDHIKVAKKAYLYISTSLSETKGMALMEQWSAGVPSVTHPKIYQHGENYKTGIITNRDVDSYCEAISEIANNARLRSDLSMGAREFILNKFNPKLITEQYLKIIKNVS